ncbi:uncharacterized protein BXZ73DRAFT_105201 [Epithele typhae]|uniref:uncharacterized protein n=1 Tax=Epithele typhae TaxID=378194 RepID=UPI002007F99D|nr:uncharacterized protein BXZ73DRAFT_105201 [Epithele typhae]KAH9918565.1 hypothetical protein BXZ73DRAFT_105201 [Epithele typhae]
MSPLPVILRVPLWIVLWVFAGILTIITIVRLSYTTHLPPGDTLNGGRDFFDPIVVELLVSSILALGTIPFVLRWIPPQFSSQSSNNVFELGSVGLLWLFWLSGCVVSTSIWPDLSFCAQFAQCRTLSAMMAFAWLGWVALTGLGVIAILAVAHKARAPSSPMMVEWAGPPRPRVDTVSV